MMLLIENCWVVIVTSAMRLKEVTFWFIQMSTLKNDKKSGDYLISEP